MEGKFWDQGKQSVSAYHLMLNCNDPVKSLKRIKAIMETGQDIKINELKLNTNLFRQ